MELSTNERLRLALQELSTNERLRLQVLLDELTLLLAVLLLTTFFCRSVGVSFSSSWFAVVARSRGGLAGTASPSKFTRDADKAGSFFCVIDFALLSFVITVVEAMAFAIAGVGDSNIDDATATALVANGDDDVVIISTTDFTLVRRTVDSPEPERGDG